MKKLGIAISLYDKVDCLKTNVNIIRKFWEKENDSFISVCCNDPNSFLDVQSLDIDKFTPGDNIQISEKSHRRLRIFDCIEKSISECKAKFVIHYHSDAYALDVSEILKIVDHMEQNGKHVAFRGRGVDYRSDKCIHGDVDDHFVIFRKEEIIKRKLFDIRQINPSWTRSQYFRVGNPETFLSLIIQTCFSQDERYFYSDMRNNLVDEKVPLDDFYEDKIMHRSANPYNIDSKRKFLHIGDNQIIFNMLMSQGLPESLICVNSASGDSLQTLPREEKHVDEWLNE